MSMTYSGKGLAVTESFEGLRLTAYKDSVGVWTIGYGHTGPEVHEGLTCTQQEAESWLANDIHFASNCVITAITSDLTQGEFDALVDFTFNVGCKAFCNSTMRKRINEGDYSGAALQFEFWDFAGGKQLAGLLRRRQAERREFEEADTA